MNKTFCIAGPVRPDKHYCLSQRLNSQELHQLIDEEKYFILHAPRQTGKTTAILNFVQQLNSEGKCRALYVNVEPAQAAGDDVERGLRTVITSFKKNIGNTFGMDDPAYQLALRFEATPTISGGALEDFITQWAGITPSPLVLFIDEIDSLVGDTLLSVLRQVRSGYESRPEFFPQSICLIGVRDVRDYLIWSEKEQEKIRGGSAFNIKAESLRLGDFSPEEVAALYKQHTDATGQIFTPEAVEYAFYLTQGQPWLVNALAYQACFRDVKDRSLSITKEVIDRAKEVLILRRDTHLDVLIDRLNEERVRRIIQMLVLGEGEEIHISTDDLSYVRDLGLVTQKGLAIANPIYQEIIPRELTFVQQAKLEEMVDRRPFIRADGSLNIPLLLEKFGQFYREQSSAWIEVLEFKEIGPHILLLAFLQRIINGGGSIHREYALGRKRVDLLVIWKNQRIVIELKIRRGEKGILEGLIQTAGYMDASHATEGHLVVFDQSLGKSWDEKIFTRQEQVEGKTITVWGM